MSFPFGGHPQLVRYMLWARDEHDFRAQSGTASDEDGQPYHVIKIYKHGGPSVVVVGVSQEEYLSPSQVANLDRRLGLNSPWFGIPNGED